MAQNNRLNRLLSAVILVVVLLCAAALRLHGLHWDGDMGAYPHPDERHLASTMGRIFWPTYTKNLLDPAHSLLNPRRVNPEDPGGGHYDLAYGTLPVYLYRGATAFLSSITGRRWNAYAQAFTVGRAITILFSLLTILLVYLIGREIHGRACALLAAAFLGFGVTHIQLSHFMTVDVIMTAFVTACLYVGLRFVREGRWSNALLMGVAAGGAMATKAASAMLVATLLTAFLLWEARPGGGNNGAPLENTENAEDAAPLPRSKSNSLKGGRPVLLYPLLIILGVCLTFGTFEFYTVLDPATYLHAVGQQGKMVSGAADWPFTRQYVNTAPYLYHLQNLVRWGLGFPLGIAALGGFLLAVARLLLLPLSSIFSISLLKRKPYWERLREALYAAPIRWGSLLLLSWALPYFLYVGRLEVKFMRYMLPLVPLLCLLAADMTLWLARQAARFFRRGTGRLVQGAVVGLVLLPTILWALAFSRIYDRPHTWEQASRWLYANAPPGSVLTHELWDDALPVDIAAEDLFRRHYQLPIAVDIYQDMSPEAKFRHLAEAIHQADFIILTTPRLYGAVRRLPWRYPVEIRYYELLFTEQLGFDLAYAATSYPTLWGWTFVDDEADESFSVYDHPKALIYRKGRDVSDQELRALFGQALEAEPLITRRGREQPVTLPVPRYRQTLLLEQPVDALPPTDDYAWNEAANAHHLLAVLIWLAVLEVVTWTALPLTCSLFPAFLDRGYTLAKTLGLLLLAYGAWLGVNLGLWSYSRLALLLALLLLALVSGLSGRGWREFLRRRWREVLIYEGVFLAAFVFFLLLRLVNPDLWHPVRGGEKPMEFGFLNAILRSPTMPPYDPFFSGGYINYYYYGLFLVSTLVKLTGIAPSIAFNLIVPTLFALTFAGAFGVVYNLTGRRRYGLAGGFFVAVAGNLAAVGPIRGVGGLSDVFSALDQLAPSQVQGDLLRLLAGLGRWLTGATLPLRTDWFWDASRVHGPYETSITEFPFFSFLFADLHPHLIGIPCAILVIALVLSLIQAAGRKPQAKYMRYAIISLGLGSLLVINSWDFPVYVLVVGGGLVLRRFLVERAYSRGLVDTLGGVMGIAIKAALLAGGGVIFYLPFFTYFKTFVKGFGRVRYPTEVGYYVGMFGFFLFVLVSCLVLKTYDRFKHKGTKESGGEQNGAEVEADANLPKPGFGGLFRGGRWLWAAFVLLPLLVLIIVPLFYGALNFRQLATFVLIGDILLLTIVCLLEKVGTPQERFTLLLGLVGLAVSLGVEVIYVRDHLSGGDAYRMNTVFKFYVQVWVLLAIAAAASLNFIRRRLAQGYKGDKGSLPPAQGRSALAAFWWNCFVILLLAASVYPVFATQARLRDRFPRHPPVGTLDGVAYMSLADYDWEGHRIFLEPDYKAIRWLLENVRGTPVVLQAGHEFYRANGTRIAYNTGFPTVLSYLHENEQRYPQQVSQRHTDVENIYNNPDAEAVLPLLVRYDVSYIYVGPFERAVYQPEGLTKFDSMLESHLRLVYDEEGVRIYHLREETKAAYGGQSPDAWLAVPTLPPAPPSPREEEELRRLEQAAQAQPDDIGLQSQLGRRYRELGRYQEAVRVFQEALKRHPEDVAMRHILGDTYAEMGQPEKALEQYQEAVQVAPHNPAAHHKLGMAYMERNRLNEAVAAFRTAVEVDPDFVEAYYHLGEAYERLGERDKAREAYSECLTRGDRSAWVERSRERLRALGE